MTYKFKTLTIFRRGRSIGHKVEVAHFLKEAKTGFSMIHAINCNDLVILNNF